MSVLPQNRPGWIRTAVLPLQAFVVFGWMAVRIYNALDVFGSRPSSDFEAMVIAGYALCFFDLLAGGVIQRRYGDRRGSTASFILALAALVAGGFMLPELARP